MIRLISFIIVSLLYNNVYGQNQTSCNLSFSGKVLESVTGLGLEDAIVFIPSLQKGTRTNALGEFSLKGLCDGNFVIRIQHLNHEPIEENVNLASNIKSKIFFMTCHQDTLHEIAIRQHRIHWEDVTVMHKLQEMDLMKLQGLSLGKTLESINGVYNLSTGNNISKPMIRGLHSNRVIIMNNGIRQEGQQWGNEHAPEIDQSMAKSIELVKGPQSLRYGSDIIGGLILVNPKPMRDIQGSGGEVNLAGFSNGRLISSTLMLEGKIKKLHGVTWRAQTAFKRSGNARTPDYFLKNTGMQELNYSLSLGWRVNKWNFEAYHSNFSSEIGIFAGSHIGNLTDLYKAFNSPEPIDSAGFSYKIGFPYQQINHSLTKLIMNWKFSPGAEFYGIYGYQKNKRKEFDKNLLRKNADGGYDPALNFELNTHNFDLGIRHDEISHSIGNIGFNGFYQTNNYYGAYFIPNYQKFQGGFYVTEKWHKRRLSVDLGLRYDVNTFDIQKWESNILISKQHVYHGFASILSGRYQFEGFAVHANVGSTWRAPFVNELYSFGVHHSAASFEIGDRNLTPERSYNASITMDYVFKRILDLELTFFNNYIHDYINLQPQLPATLTIRGAFPTFAYSQTNANFNGIEFSSSLHIMRKVKWGTKANVLWVRNITQDKFIVGMPPARLETNFDFTLLSKTRLNCTLNPTISYTFRQNRVADSDDYVASPAGYTLLNGELLTRYQKGKQALFITFGASNILNVRYRDYLNRNRYFANELGRNVFLKCSIPFSKNIQKTGEIQIITN